MNLDSDKGSEVSQKKKKKYILMHTYGIQKDGTDKAICRAAGETQTQTRRGAEGAGGMCGDSNRETYTTTRTIESQWESAL